VDFLISSIIFPNFDAEEEIKIEFQLVYNGHPVNAHVVGHLTTLKHQVKTCPLARS